MDLLLLEIWLEHCELINSTKIKYLLMKTTPGFRAYATLKEIFV